MGNLLQGLGLSIAVIDEEFLEQLNVIIQENIHKPDLDVQHLAESMNMSKSTLYRKNSGVSNLAPNELPPEKSSGAVNRGAL